MIDKFFSVCTTIFGYINIAIGPFNAAVSFGEGDFAQGGFHASATVVFAVLLIRKAIIDHD